MDLQAQRRFPTGRCAPAMILGFRLFVGKLGHSHVPKSSSRPSSPRRQRGARSGTMPSGADSIDGGVDRGHRHGYRCHENRRVDPADALCWARLISIAAHGTAEAVYAGLVPGQSTEQIIADRRFRAEGRAFLLPELVACRGTGENGRRLNAYPMDGKVQPSGTISSARIASGFSGRWSCSRPKRPEPTSSTSLPSSPPHRPGASLDRAGRGEARAVGIKALSLHDVRGRHRLVGYYQRLGFAAMARARSCPRVPSGRRQLHPDGQAARRPEARRP